MIVGVTGRMAVGKSWLCRQLVDSFGCAHYNADARAKVIMAEQNIITDEGIFHDGAAYEKMKKQVWPLVLADAQKWSKKLSVTGFIESSVLFESGLSSLCDRTIALTADAHLCQSRSKLSESAYASRVAWQLTNVKLKNLCDANFESEEIALAEKVYAWLTTAI